MVGFHLFAVCTVWGNRKEVNDYYWLVSLF